MSQTINFMENEPSTPHGISLKKQENSKNRFSKDVMAGSELWTDGLICAFEFVGGHKKPIRSKSCSRIHSSQQINGNDSRKQVLSSGHVDASDQSKNRNSSLDSASLIDIEINPIVTLDGQNEGNNPHSGNLHNMDRYAGSYWLPIGWARISELVQSVQIDASWAQQPIEFMEDEDDLTVQDVAAPYWERAAGPTWWCHVAAGHPSIGAWLGNAQWLHPAVSIALRDENRLISERMKHLLYEVPVRVAGGLLFELLGQSVGDPFVNEDDIPVVIRSWQAQRFLITALHVKGSAANINVLGITEVQELLSAGGANTPRTVHDVIAHLACRLARWDDRLFRKTIFGTADEVELKFMNRRNHEDMNLFTVILNQEIQWLSKQVIRVKWSLHAREEIVFELLQHLKGNAARSMLEGVRKNTREMIEEQEAVRGRLFTIQDVMQSTVRAWLQDKSLRITHNLAVFGGCGLILSIITGLFGINVDGIPGATGTPYAFALFTGILICIGIFLIIMGVMYFGLKRPITEEQFEVRKLELDELVKIFQHDAEHHVQVRNDELRRRKLSPTAADLGTNGAQYILMA